MSEVNLTTTKNILIAFILNISFAIFEFFGGLFTGSVAILSDSVHDLGDALSIGLSFVLEKKSKKRPDEHYTYGYVRYSVMGSLITTVILLVGSLIVIFESVKRIINPVTINYNGMLLIALFGVVINFIAAIYTAHGASLNQKAINLHMLEDVLGWLVVLIGAILMKFTDITLIDPILSILVALFILINTFKNLQKIIDLFLEKTPKDIDIEKIKNKLLTIKNVYDIHHIHIRSLDGFNNYATMHVVTNKYSEDLKKEIKKVLHKYNINHSTIEIELKNENCQDLECHVNSVTKEHHHH